MPSQPEPRFQSICLSATLKFAWLSIAAVLVGSPVLGYAQLRVSVSPEFVSIHERSSVPDVNGQALTVNLPKTPMKDRYQISVAARSGSVKMAVVDMADVIEKADNPTFYHQGDSVSWGSRTISVEQARGDGMVLFAIPGRGTAQVTVKRVGVRPRQVTRQFEQYLQGVLDVLNNYYRTPNISVVVKPCGTINATYDPAASTVTMCAELVNYLIEQDMGQALLPILFHELGHGLLHKWELPGWDNEDFVDEFAAIHLQYWPGSADALVKFFSQSDPVAEAVRMIDSGDRHSLSLQRARNIRAWAAKPEPIERRWFRLLMPYRK